jgi:hypothetical protein
MPPLGLLTAPAEAVFNLNIPKIINWLEIYKKYNLVLTPYSQGHRIKMRLNKKLHAFIL